MSDEGEINRYDGSDDIVILARKSWTAYVRPALLWLIPVPILLAITSGNFWLITLMIVLPLTALVVYQILVLRSYVLFYDANGVWVFSGILPWTKRTNGVKWRDLNGAEYFTGFASWLFKSHTVIVRHRFTESGQIVLDHMEHGDRLVPVVNSRFSELARAGLLT